MLLAQKIGEFRSLGLLLHCYVYHHSEPFYDTSVLLQLLLIMHTQQTESSLSAAFPEHRAVESTKTIGVKSQSIDRKGTGQGLTERRDIEDQFLTDQTQAET